MGCNYRYDSEISSRLKRGEKISHIKILSGDKELLQNQFPGLTFVQIFNKMLRNVRTNKRGDKKLRKKKGKSVTAR